MSDREQLIRRVANEVRAYDMTLFTDHDTALVLAALDRLGYEVVRREVECTCGYGGVHEELNERCARNRVAPG